MSEAFFDFPIKAFSQLTSVMNGRVGEVYYYYSFHYPKRFERVNEVLYCSCFYLMGFGGLSCDEPLWGYKWISKLYHKKEYL
ncbi:hypothetical protein Syun_005388 [Stephania yunnanensis]|uniref:Uncharacterized protein n=1 Tax=Stephania yunnanensis TaxID=152371 RepID=A0AAP0Q5W4_9MAGN